MQILGAERDADSASPCRLFVYLATEAPIGVVLRRGPSGWARLSLWHTDSDTFEHGQWLAARVYERRCDLSPDGRLFVSFVRKSSSPARTDSWLAISRPPYFTALAIWFIGGTYHTGGMFADRSTVWPGFVEAPPDEGKLPDWLAVATQPRLYVDRTNNWTDRTTHFNRLLRDGWAIVGDGPSETTFERAQPSGRLKLGMTQRFDERMFAAYGGPYAVEYWVESDSDGDLHPLGRAAWADWDQRGRLVMAREGRLIQWEPRDVFEEIADFNGQSPNPAPAPPWAREWPNGLESNRE